MMAGMVSSMAPLLGLQVATCHGVPTWAFFCLCPSLISVFVSKFPLLSKTQVRLD